MTKPYFSALFALLRLPSVLAVPETVTFPSGEITLHGVLYKPEGTGPFPAVIYNHGSAPGMMSKEAFAALGPVFAGHGWVFFGPYLPAGAGIECLGRPVYWRSDRGCRESRRRLCGCRNDGAVIGDGSFERSVRSPSVVAKTEFRSIESHRGGGKLVWWHRNCAGSRTRMILCGDRFCGGRSELVAGS